MQTPYSSVRDIDMNSELEWGIILCCWLIIRWLNPLKKKLPLRAKVSVRKKLAECRICHDEDEDLKMEAPCSSNHHLTKSAALPRHGRQSEMASLKDLGDCPTGSPWSHIFMSTCHYVKKEDAMNLMEDGDYNVYDEKQQVFQREAGSNYT